MIGLLDFLKTAGITVSLESLKIHLACWNGEEDPLEVYHAGKFKEWQEEQNNRNFQRDLILSLIDLGKSNWLFVGVYRVLGCVEGPKYWQYSTDLLPGQENLIGRIVVSHKRTARACYLLARPELTFPIIEILRKKLSIEEFPGHNAVVISHGKLQIITEQKVASWHGALANIKGVYLITDTKTGKHYVGSATGDDGIWQRWCSYAANGHGGNVDLKKVLKAEEPEYRAHFQYSILEIADTHATDKHILARESYWKDVLRSREFGWNLN